MDLVAGTATQEARRHMRQCFSASGGLISPQHCIDVMVESIRHVSQSLPGTVGPDCMAVHIQGASPMVTVSYKPSAQDSVGIGPGGEVGGPLAYTPFVVSRDMVSQPAVSVNNMFMAPPGVDIRFECGPTVPVDRMPALMFAQSRKPPPA
jgi:hypothetical protein